MRMLDAGHKNVSLHLSGRSFAKRAEIVKNCEGKTQVAPLSVETSGATNVIRAIAEAALWFEEPAR